MSDLPTPEPVINPETEEFWQATTEGRLLLRGCNDCGESYHYPRAICPHCFSDDTEFAEAAGTGEVYSYTVTHQAGGGYGEAAPFVLAYVELDESPRVMTNIVDVDPDDVEVGMPVEVTFDAVNDEAALFRFRPA